jgi:hypothetical protein
MKKTVVVLAYGTDGGEEKKCIKTFDEETS